MAEDLMNTQTGGEGETIQLQPEVQTTPDQFDVKINPPVDSEPISTQPITPEQQLPIEPTTPVIEEQQTIVEGEPIEPPVTREEVAEVSLSDDAETKSAIQDLGIPTEAPVIPSQVDLSQYTINGVKQHNAEDTPAEKIEQISTFNCTQFCSKFNAKFKSFYRIQFPIPALKIFKF
jgi:hypothetical protein